jgi:hypothetical protein
MLNFAIVLAQDGHREGSVRVKTTGMQSTKGQINLVKEPFNRALDNRRVRTSMEKSGSDAAFKSRKNRTQQEASNHLRVALLGGAEIQNLD